MDLEEKSISKKIKSILKPSSNKARESNYPISTTKAVKGVLSSAECFTSDPAPRVRKEPEPEPELYNYKGQVVTRSAMELLEAEDRLAAKGGLFERDGMILTLWTARILLDKGSMVVSLVLFHLDFAKPITFTCSGCLGSHTVSPSGWAVLLCLNISMILVVNIFQDGRRNWIRQINGRWYRKTAECPSL
jgi:hypothetical protein